MNVSAKRTCKYRIRMTLKSPERNTYGKISHFGKKKKKKKRIMTRFSKKKKKGGGSYSPRSSEMYNTDLRNLFFTVSKKIQSPNERVPGFVANS